MFLVSLQQGCNRAAAVVQRRGSENSTKIASKSCQEEIFRKMQHDVAELQQHSSTMAKTFSTRRVHPKPPLSLFPSWNRPRGLSRAQRHGVPAGASRRRHCRGAGGKNRPALNRLTLAELQTVDKAFGRDTLGFFNLKTAMAKRNLTGAPSMKEVAKQLARWREQLS
jgi:hypothetical protein